MSAQSSHSLLNHRAVLPPNQRVVRRHLRLVRDPFHRLLPTLAAFTTSQMPIDSSQRNSGTVARPDQLDVCVMPRTADVGTTESARLPDQDGDRAHKREPLTLGRHDRSGRGERPHSLVRRPGRCTDRALVCVWCAPPAWPAPLAAAGVDRRASRAGVRVTDHHGDRGLDRQAQRQMAVPAGSVVRDSRGGDRAAGRDAGGGDLRGVGDERNDARAAVPDPGAAQADAAGATLLPDQQDPAPPRHASILAGRSPRRVADPRRPRGARSVAATRARGRGRHVHKTRAGPRNPS